MKLKKQTKEKESNTIIYNRETHKYYKEQSYGGKQLRFLYNNIFGALLLNILISKPKFSELCSLYFNSIISKKDINKFINKYSINMNCYEDKKYSSFNDFFTRNKKEDYIQSSSDNDLIAPCDGKLLVTKIDESSNLEIKGTSYNISELLNSNSLAKKFISGYALVFRLTADDCHVYRYIDKGCTLVDYKIQGRLHTVQQINKKYKVLKKNTRVINLLNTNHFGEILYIEVGALLIGKIVNNNYNYFDRLDVKGHFEYGASTIVILTKILDNLVIDKDILDNSEIGIETKVSAGEIIGHMEDKTKC